MTNTHETLKVITFEDGRSAVVQIDAANPRLLEVVAMFYDAAKAREYAALQQGQECEPLTKHPEPLPPQVANGKRAEANGVAPELSARQSAVLNVLRARMDENKQVETKAADLAQAAKIPLGSLHSVLGSLEKKQLIANKRSGTPKAPAVYQVM